jgi:hypothetical protein
LSYATSIRSVSVLCESVNAHDTSSYFVKAWVWYSTRYIAVYAGAVYVRSWLLY